jgi:6-phosphogluconolactonase/glucosamine-6-phosphate isomerase/deaminase
MKIISDKKNIKEKAGNALNEMVASRGDKPLLLLLSGGSSFDLLDYVTDESLKGGITIGMLDDRYSFDYGINGYLKLQGSEFANDFFLRAMNQAAVFLNSAPAQTESLELYAERYEAYIKEWMNLYPDGIIRATVGIGPDGHTSGILPFPEDPKTFEKLFNGEKLVVGYNVGDKSPFKERMTSTFTLMKKFDQVLTYMTGDAKKEALAKVMAEEGSLAETPGRIIKELNNVTVFTDIL